MRCPEPMTTFYDNLSEPSAQEHDHTTLCESTVAEGSRSHNEYPALNPLGLYHYHSLVDPADALYSQPCCPELASAHLQGSNELHQYPLLLSSDLDLVECPEPNSSTDVGEASDAFDKQTDTVHGYPRKKNDGATDVIAPLKGKSKGNTTEAEVAGRATVVEQALIIAEDVERLARGMIDPTMTRELLPFPPEVRALPYGQGKCCRLKRKRSNGSRARTSTRAPKSSSSLSSKRSRGTTSASSSKGRPRNTKRRSTRSAKQVLQSTKLDSIQEEPESCSTELHSNQAEDTDADRKVFIIPHKAGKAPSQDHKHDSEATEVGVEGEAQNHRSEGCNEVTDAVSMMSVATDSFAPRQPDTMLQSDEDSYNPEGEITEGRGLVTPLPQQNDPFLDPNFERRPLPIRNAEWASASQDHAIPSAMLQDIQQPIPGVPFELSHGQPGQCQCIMLEQYPYLHAYKNWKWAVRLGDDDWLWTDTNHVAQWMPYCTCSSHVIEHPASFAPILDGAQCDCNKTGHEQNPQ
ncbi:MAG: hypothetical protein Q9159_000617 [Coniocarpon cinnabarinum]